MPDQLTLNEISAAVVAIEQKCQASYCHGMPCDVCSYGNASRKLLAMADKIKIMEARDGK